MNSTRGPPGTNSVELASASRTSDSLTWTGAYTEAQAIAADCWPAPEYETTMNRTELGDLGLTPAQERAIVAFMKTLSDGYTP